MANRTFDLGSVRGPQGIQGPEGSRGKAATIKVGTVTTGEPGTEATVVNEGTDNDAVLSFVIPRGDQGKQGDNGASTAAEVSIADAKGEFTAQNVEDALSELKGETKYATEQADKLRLALFNSEDINMSEDISKISLKKTNVVERDDDRVVTSAAVYTKVETEIGNINALLETI